MTQNLHEVSCGSFIRFPLCPCTGTVVKQGGAGGTVVVRPIHVCEEHVRRPNGWCYPEWWDFEVWVEPLLDELLKP